MCLRIIFSLFILIFSLFVFFFFFFFNDTATTEIYTLSLHDALPNYDVVIIGSGAGGGTLAYRLAPTGLRVLLVERGDYVRRELENWDSAEVFGKARYK